MLAPQSGHTQFRMPDITFELTPIAADLIAGICRHIHLHERQGTISCLSASFRSCTSRRAEKLNRKCCLHFAFQTLGGEIFVGLSSENCVVQMNASELSSPASEGHMAMRQERQSPS
jgi:hypothetical protein